MQLTEVTDSSDEDTKIIIGVCAMDKKARSNPMQEIIKRLTRHGEFRTLIFGDEMILHRPAEEWPICDCLFSWHSEHFPLSKAEEYVALRKPYVINDLSKQRFLRDRRKVYAMLREAGIQLPVHIVVNRDGLLPGKDPEGFVETPDYIEMSGVRICKPFVEKPVSGDNHNINIYYPQQKGGGVKCLFRKRDNRSAEYMQDHPGHVRRDGSFIYEEFLTTGGTDVKVYTVGPRYAHAEARKSPVVDGVVLRTADGKERRFPVVLDTEEKEIARRVTLVFGQKVCGFDLLRSERGPVVCDVNGWSFVKSSYQYYEDAAGLLRRAILEKLAPHKMASYHKNSSFHGDRSVSLDTEMNRDPNSFADLHALKTKGNEKCEWEELRCVLMVARHGDRTPKQKMKMIVKEESFLELFEKYKDSKGCQATLKAPAQLQELLDVTRSLLRQMTKSEHNDLSQRSSDGSAKKGEARREASDSEQEARDFVDEYREKFRIIISVLEAGGHFSGINRKVQLKPVRCSTPSPELTEAQCAKEVLLILKYGGTLTHAGRQQAEQFGRQFRTTMYPGEDNSEGPSGGGLLRLHSTYRHDLKIYSSDEGRVQTSAAAFAKGMLALEGTSLTPILVSLLQKDTGMLDSFDKGASEEIQKSKGELYNHITWNEDKHRSMQSPARNMAGATPPSSPSRVTGEALLRGQERASKETLPLDQMDGAAARNELEPEEELKPSMTTIPANCLELLHNLVHLIENLVDQLRRLCLNERSDSTESQRPYSSLSQDPNEWEAPSPAMPCTGERLLLVYDRWRKLLKSFYNAKKNQFDISKVPDLYDSAKYDAIHNGHLNLDLEELYDIARTLGNLVIPSEYGIDPEAKLRIGVGVCSQLLGKLLVDMANTREESVVASRILDESERKRDWHNSHRNMDFGDTGFFDDFHLQSNQFFDDTVVRKQDVGETTESSSISSESPRESAHRLHAEYATDINSPLRHVRTRIYFTSESHIHALMNVLKYGISAKTDLDSDEVPQVDSHTIDIAEYDYLSHLVFRLYENPRLPIDDEKRFRVEVLFSPGAAYNPFEKRREEADWLHVLPIQPRMKLYREEGLTLKKLEDMLQPFSTPRKISRPFAWLTSQQA